MEKLQLPTPITFRRNIPFFYDKTEAEFKQDKYENYANVVARQTRLHLSKLAWHNYPFQPILDWILSEVGEITPANIVEIGCSVGRLIGELAMRFPIADCWGIDYSYQLLRQANDYWIDGKILELMDEFRGFKKEKITGKQLPNLQFGLAKGERLPFDNNAVNLVVSSFTLDRFDEPKVALREMFRVLKTGGKALIVSPLNFQKATHWVQYFPIEKLLKVIENIGFNVNRFDENLVIQELLDARGNELYWQCMAISLNKN